VGSSPTLGTNQVRSIEPVRHFSGIRIEDATIIGAGLWASRWPRGTNPNWGLCAIQTLSVSNTSAACLSSTKVMGWQKGKALVLGSSVLS
jgi:hypothetical protein